MRYGWYLRHVRTGKLVRVDPVADRVDVVDTTWEATQFPEHDHARDMLWWLQSGTEPMPACDIVDATIPEEPAPDVRQVRSQEEIIKEARERGLKDERRFQVDLLTTEQMEEKRARRRNPQTGFGAGGFGGASLAAQRQIHQGVNPRPLFTSRPPATPAERQEKPL